MPSYLVVESATGSGTTTASANWTWTIDDVTYSDADGDSMAFPPSIPPMAAQANVENNNGYAHSGIHSSGHPTNPRQYEAQVIAYEGTQSSEPWLDTRTVSGNADAHEEVALKIEPEAWDAIGDRVRVQLFTTTLITLGGFLRAGTTGSGTGTATYSLGGGHTVVGQLRDGYADSDLVTMDAAVGDTFTITLDTSSWYSSTDKNDASDMHASVISKVKLFDPDLSPVDLKVTGQGAPSTVEYQFFVENSDVKQSFDIDFYWATGFNFEDRLGGPVYTVTVPAGPDTTVGVHSGQFDFSQLGILPPDATHLIMNLDAKDSVREENEYWNDWSAEIPSPSSTLNVVAKYDDEPSPTVFGRYLKGVDLKNPVTISSTNPAARIAKVFWGVDGAPRYPATRVKGTSQWTFDGNVAKPGRPALAAGTHTVNVAAYDSLGNEIGTFQGEVIVADTLDFELRAKVGSDLKNEEDLRFIRGIAANIAFTGTITDLPEFYKDRVEVFVDAAKVTPKSKSVQGRTLTLEFDYDASKLKAGLGGAPATTNVKAAIRRSAPKTSGSLPVDTVFGDETEKLTAIGAPSWLTVTNTNWLFDAALGQYELNHAEPLVPRLSAGRLTTGIGWLDRKLRGSLVSASLTADVDVVVPLDVGDEPTVTFNKLTAHGTMLGATFWHEEYTSADVTPQAKLNGTTLMPESFSLALSHAVTVGSATFLDKRFKVPILPNLSPAVTITAGLGLTLTGELTVNGAGLELTWAGNQLEWVSAGTFIDLTASVTGRFSAIASAAVAGGWLGTYEAWGTVEATLSIDGRADLGGPVSSPTRVSAQLIGTLSGSYYYSLIGTPTKTGDKVEEKDEPAGTFGPVELFRL